MTKKINVVLQGGSVKGIAYVGALKALVEQIPLENIGCVAGTSAGSLTAALLALGCTVEQIENLTCAFDFKEILDDTEGGINTRTPLLKSIDKVENGYSFFFAKMPVKAVVIPISHRLLNEGGIYEGEFLRNWVENRIREQVSTLTQGEYEGIHLTFAELHELTIRYPGIFHDLFVSGSDLSTREKVVFSYKNPHTKDAILSDVIRVSMSIPYLFKPHMIYYKIDGERRVETSQALWTDGGIYDNYLIDIFDDVSFIGEDDEPLQQASDGRFYNPQTIGFRLVSFEEDNTSIASKIKALTQEIVGAGFALQDAFYNRPENKQRTIYIDHLNISLLAFNLSDQQKANLIESGYQATKTCFEGPLGEQFEINESVNTGIFL